MYLDDIAAAIREKVPQTSLPESSSDQLFRIYAVLLRAKGAEVTQSDVHDAWSAWIAGFDEEHQSLVPYGDLSSEIQAQDRVFATAIRRAAEELGHEKPSRPLFLDALFPNGEPKTETEKQHAIDLYKMMVASSEGLVSRRQTVNTFFLTMNGALLTAMGLIVQSTQGREFSTIGIFVLAIAGVVLSQAWRSLLTSFGQLNTGKFKVINTIERYLSVSIYGAEWEALERGEDPKIYQSFTSREIWVPNALVVLHLVAAVAAILMFFNCLPIEGFSGAA